MGALGPVPATVLGRLDAAPGVPSTAPGRVPRFKAGTGAADAAAGFTRGSTAVGRTVDNRAPGVKIERGNSTHKFRQTKETNPQKGGGVECCKCVVQAHVVVVGTLNVCIRFLQVALQTDPNNNNKAELT